MTKAMSAIKAGDQSAAHLCGLGELQYRSGDWKAHIFVESFIFIQSFLFVYLYMLHVLQFHLCVLMCITCITVPYMYIYVYYMHYISQYCNYIICITFPFFSYIICITCPFFFFFFFAIPRWRLAGTRYILKSALHSAFP